MALSHKHLAITAREWDAFMAAFYSVTEEFDLPTSDVEDLQAVLLSMRDDCISEGTAADAHPAVSTATGTTRSSWFRSAPLYERLGGVYPIALFVDRLIDALLAGDRPTAHAPFDLNPNSDLQPTRRPPALFWCHFPLILTCVLRRHSHLSPRPSPSDPRVSIPVDGQRRNEASLKYLFMEAVCAIAGGPEVVTSLAYAETRLLLPARQMFFLLEAAKDASDHIPSSKLRAELLQALHQASADYIVDQRTSSPTSQRHSERAVQIEALSRRAG